VPTPSQEKNGTTSMFPPCLTTEYPLSPLATRLPVKVNNLTKVYNIIFVFRDCCWQFERKSVRNIFGRLIEQKQQWILEKNEGIDWRSQRIRLLYQFLRNGHHKGQALPTCEEMAHNGWIFRSNQDFRWIHAKIVLHWVH